jgi:hypothetical protein
MIQIISKFKEREFSKNGYLGEKSSKLFKIRNGKIPVLISAPHTIKYNNREDNIKKPEFLTGTLVNLIQKSTNVYSIYRISSTDNPIKNELDYRNAIKEIIEKENIQLFIEFHGCKDEHKFDLEIGTDNGKNCIKHENIEFLFKDFLEQSLLKEVVINKKFKASQDYTNCKWVNNEFNISSIQIEISKTFRNIKDLKRFTSVYLAFKRLIKYISPSINKKIIIGEIGETKSIIPHNRIDIVTSKEFLKKNELFNLDCYEKFEDCSVLKKIVLNDNLSLPQINITKRAFKKRKYLSKIGLISKKETIKATFLKPSSENILNTNECVISKKLWLKLNKPNNIYLSNNNGNTRIQLSIKKIVERNGDYVFLNYTQRRLLNLEIPYEISKKKYETLIKENIIFKEFYSSKTSSYILENHNSEEYYKVALAYKKSFGSFEVSKIERSTNFDHRLLTDFFIGKKHIHLRTSRSFGIDEPNNIVRISKDNCKVLGIEEGDKIIIKSIYSRVKAKVLCYDNTEMFLKENGIFDANEIEFLISIPTSLRVQLKLSDVGDVVSIKRDTLFILLKNLNNQFFSLIGLVITIFTLPEKIIKDDYKLTAILILLPFIIWLTFSKERSKIK